MYFSDRLYSEDELPAEFKLYLPVQNKAKVRECICNAVQPAYVWAHKYMRSLVGNTLAIPNTFETVI